MAVAAVVAGDAEDLSTSLKLAAWFPVCLLLLSIDYTDIYLNWSQWQALTPVSGSLCPDPSLHLCLLWVLLTGFKCWQVCVFHFRVLIAVSVGCLLLCDKLSRPSSKKLTG